jgi:CheY-like chemotaxis protein
MVDDLLEVARITMGKVEFKPGEVEVHPIVTSSLETTRPLMDSRRHEVHVEVSPEPMWLRADPVRVEQMVTNLLNNAAKFTEPGGVISLRVSAEAGFLVVRVLDNGIGMDAETLARVFEPFAQADRARGYSQGGLGVGLSLVRRFAQLHGGTVSAFSSGPGTGSEFTLRLPLITAAANAGAAERREDQASSRLRILVVDDNTDAAESLRILLELDGHQVMLAHTGPSAVQQASLWTPEVVLLDIGLPGLDGYQVAAELRKMPAMAAATIIAMTGFGRPSDVAQAASSGFDEHLVKPVDPARIAVLLKEVVQRK